MEDTLDPLSAPPELFSPNTNEVVVAFKGVVPYSRYVNDKLISRRLNILFIKKWGPPVLAHGDIMWIFTEFSDGTTPKEVYDSTPAHPRAAPSAPSRPKVQTLARAFIPRVKAPPSREVIVLDEQLVTPSYLPLVAQTRGSLCPVCRVTL